MATITGIAVASPNLNVLVNVLTYLDDEISGSNLVATLDAAGADLTVFAPTDTAFGRLAQDLGFTGNPANETAVTNFLVGALPATTLRDVILYHVSAGAKTLAEVAALPEVDTLNGATFTADGPTLVDAEPDLLDPSLINTDVAADNGIVHVIDRVLLPVNLAGNRPDTITAIVAASGGTPDANGGDFDILLTAVQAAGLAATLDDQTADFTVFAPTDDAFLGLATALGFTGTDEAGALTYILDSLELLGKGDTVGLLTQILTYHVVGESLQASQVLSSATIPTLQGGDLTVNGTDLGDADPDIADPGIIATDIIADNGIVHAIDGVLLPVDVLTSNGANAVQFEIGTAADEALAGAADNDFLSGKGGRDVLVGAAGNDVLIGGQGSDVVSGGTGNDHLLGGLNSDRLIGGLGRDTTDGGSGDDVLVGGAGRDVFVFSDELGRDVIADFRDGVDLIDLTDFGFASFAAVRDLAEVRQFGTVIRISDDVHVAIRGLGFADLNAADVLL